MGDMCVRQREAGPRAAAARGGAAGSAPAARKPAPAPCPPPDPQARPGRDQLRLSADYRQARAARQDNVPVVSDDQLDSVLRGHEFLLFPPPGASTGGVVGNFRVVGYAPDEAAWNQLGRPEGFKPLAYLRTHLEVGPIGADVLVNAKNGNGEQKVSVDVRDLTWNGQDVEKLAKVWALDFARKNPGIAIPAAVVIVAGGVVGAYYYSRDKGPIEFGVGSVRLFRHKGLEGSLKAKAQVDAEPLSARLNGVEARLKYDVPGDYGRVEAGARYNLTDDLWRVDTHYALPLGKDRQGYLGAGAWAEQRPEHGDRDWEFGAGVYVGFRF